MSGVASPELRRSLAEVKGQAQFLLYLADQIEESLDQLSGENDSCHGAFLCKVLSMYSSQLESKHQGLGDKIAETCQEIYVTVREVERGLSVASRSARSWACALDRVAVGDRGGRRGGKSRCRLSGAPGPTNRWKGSGTGVAAVAAPLGKEGELGAPVFRRSAAPAFGNGGDPRWPNRQARATSKAFGRIGGVHQSIPRNPGDEALASRSTRTPAGLTPPH